jgi:mRNA interferase YafQ
MYTVKFSSRFKRDLKKIRRRGYDRELLNTVVYTLARGEPLDEQYQDHALSGKFSGCRECHITPDWLLIYQYDHNELYLLLSRTGTHSDLF